MRLLLLEDDPELAPEIVLGLHERGFGVDHVTTIADADLAVAVNPYDCLVLDRTVPDGDSLDFVASLRASGHLVPILLLTARGLVSDRVSGFERGADDYLVKPFAFAELVARLRALARRRDVARAPVLKAADVELDVPRHTVTRAGILLSLTAKEFAVLEVLMEHGGDVVKRSELIDRCWDEASDPSSNVVDVLIGQLRKRLGAPDPIETLRGVGYRMTLWRARPPGGLRVSAGR